MNIILVDKSDKQIGTEEKLLAHKEGKLHRAFSIFVFNSKKELLLQRRAEGKYHSSGLWTNTCCSHPQPGKNIVKEAESRLKEEMGIDCKLKEVFSFVYKVKFANGLYEQEYDHVFFGKSDELSKPNKDEVADHKWMSLENLKVDIKENPEKYTYWLKVCLDKVMKEASMKFKQ
jgi:isopentenyl-diphosphate Delta-isomerase